MELTNLMRTDTVSIGLCVNCSLRTRSTDNVIDVIEISFRYIDQIIRDKFRPPAPEDELDDIFGTPPRAIAFDTIHLMLSHQTKQLIY